MVTMQNMSDQRAVKEQYQNTENLRLRKSLHEKYSVNQLGFQRWMFEQYPFRAGMKILELGSGRGELWDFYFEDETLQSYKMDLTLSDFSEGMVEYLCQRCQGRGIRVRKIDILDIPFESGTFDLVIANSMLYHVRDIGSALAQVRRVLKRDGLFYCATLGMNGMTQYLYGILDELGIPYKNESNLSFTLQNGAELLREQFARVERRDYEDALKIDHIEDYLDYIYSMASMQGLDRKYYDSLRDCLRSKMEGGYLHVPKEYGMFVAGG